MILQSSVTSSAPLDDASINRQDAVALSDTTVTNLVKESSDQIITYIFTLSEQKIDLAENHQRKSVLQDNYDSENVGLCYDTL